MKTKEEITKIVTDILVDKLGVSEQEVTLEANMQDDLGMDSIDAVELIMEFEREFNIRIDECDAEEISNVNDIIYFLIGQKV